MNDIDKVRRDYVQDRLIKSFGNDLANKLAVSHLSTEDLGALADKVIPKGYWCDCTQQWLGSPCSGVTSWQC